MIQSVFPVLCSSDLDASRDFCGTLLDLDVTFEGGWYTMLAAPSDPSRRVAYVLADHESVPPMVGRRPRGVLVTVEVDDVDLVHDRAREAGFEVVLGLRDEAFGQRHFMARDPCGAVLDVVQPIPPSVAFLRDVARWRRDRR